MLLGNFSRKKFHDFIAEAAKAFVPDFEKIQDGFAKRAGDADLIFCSWVLDVRTKTLERNLKETYSENL